MPIYLGIGPISDHSGPWGSSKEKVDGNSCKDRAVHRDDIGLKDDGVKRRQRPSGESTAYKLLINV